MSSWYWFLPAGLRVATLLMLPTRYWPWMMAVECAVVLCMRFWLDLFLSPPAIALSTFVPWCIYAVAVHVCQPHTVLELSSRSMPRLLLCAMAASVASGVVFGLASWIDGRPIDLALTVFTFALGDCIGIVLVVPLVLIAREKLISNHGRGTLLARGMVFVPPLMAIAAGLVPGWDPIALICALVPLVWLASHAGWRPAAISVSLLSLTVLMEDAVFQAWSGTQLQLLVAVIAGASLLIGSSREHLADQGRALSRFVDILSERTRALSDATNRITWQQEEDRRHLGHELHDQLGQDMTAIATQLRLMELGMQDPEQRNQLRSIGRLVDNAHEHLRDAINYLHPLVLDRFGLERALAAGPIAEMTRSQRIDYRCLIDGEVDYLPANVGTAIYRICQEAVTNGVRHGCGGRLHVRLTRATGAKDTDPDTLTLAIEDDAGRIDIAEGRIGFGLQGIRDRANAIGATYRFSEASGLPRHWLQIELPPATRPSATPDDGAV